MLSPHINYHLYPKFRHNLWTTYDNTPDITYLTVSHGTYEVSTEDSVKFMKIRSYCTGHHDQQSIANKSGIGADEIKSMIDSLAEIDILHLPTRSLLELSHDEIAQTLIAATTIWTEQLADTHISRDIFSGKVGKNIVIGWLLETYHYVKCFPDALALAATHASGELKHLLETYSQQERGHEHFILQTLLRAELTQNEVESSIPLISTRTIDLLLKELFALAPAAVLLVASMIEADGFDVNATDTIKQTMHKTYEFPLNLFDPFFQHVQIDDELGHQALLTNHLHLLQSINPLSLHEIVNKLHDIKHAFDLQKLEILDYYSKSGNYIPRQFVDYFAI